MKKGILLIILMALLMKSQAQTEKGNLLLGFGTSFGVGQSDGVMGLSFTREKIIDDNATVGESSITRIFGTSKVGYFISDNLATGLDLAFSFNSGKSSDDLNQINSRARFFGVGPFVRYYVPRGKILPFIEANTLFGNRNSRGTFQDTNFETNSSVANFGGGLGLAFLLGEKSSLDLGLNYNSTRLHNKETDFKTIQNSLGLRLAFTVYL
jgi:hypothetical protein